MASGNLSPPTQPTASGLKLHGFAHPPYNNKVNLPGRTVLRAGAGDRIVRVRDTLVSGKKVMISLQNEKKSLSWYSCGPSVFSSASLADARILITFDIARRILCDMARVPVDFCLGIADIGPSIADRAHENGLSPRKLARDYEARFFSDMKAFNVRPPTRVARVTEHVPEIIRDISELVKANVASTKKNGSVYFNVRNAGKDGLLDLDQTSDTTDKMLAEDEFNRHHPNFTIWQPVSGNADPDHARWDSPWGVGRPGAHVDCATIARAMFGDDIDIHSGSSGQRFVHHQQEVLVANSLYSCGCGIGANAKSKKRERWVNSWLHSGSLNVRGEAMCHRNKNAITIREYLKKGGNSDVFRMFCLQHRCGESIEYQEEKLRTAANFLQRCQRFAEAMKQHGNIVLGVNEPAKRDVDFSIKSPSTSPLKQYLEKSRDAIEEALVDDFDTPSALSVMDKLMTTAETAVNQRSGATTLICLEIGHLVSSILSMLGISGFVKCGAEPEQPQQNEPQKRSVRNEEVENGLINEIVNFHDLIREAATKKDWDGIFLTCDGIRSSFRERRGIDIKDRDAHRFTWDRLQTGSTSLRTTTEDHAGRQSGTVRTLKKGQKQKFRDSESRVGSDS